MIAGTGKNGQMVAEENVQGTALLQPQPLAALFGLNAARALRR